MNPLWHRWLLAALLVIHSLLLGYGAWIHGPGWDEIGHLPAGISHWGLGNYDLYRVNPPLVRMLATLPLHWVDCQIAWGWADSTLPRPEFHLGGQLWATRGLDAYRYLTWARWMVIPLSLLATCIIYRWSQALYGGNAGILAVSLWCFSPLVLTNAQMITPDVGSAALGVGACYLFRNWLRGTRSNGAALAVGAGLGLALLTKFTWVVLLGLWPASWLLHFYWSGKSWRRLWRWSELGQMAAIFVVAIVVINVGYEFERTMVKLGDYRFVSQPLRDPDGPPPETEPTNRFSGSWLGQVPVPLPQNYLLGIDRQKYDFEGQYHSYLRGQWRDRGWWYYYIYGIAIKEPIGFLGLLAMAACVATPRLWRDEVILLAPAVLLFGLVSSQTGFNHHLRYVLPAFPFVFIWIGKLWGDAPGVVPSDSLVDGARRQVWRQRLVGLLLLLGIVASMRVYPHSHAFFNALVGGPRHGHDHLLDSNIDWGQDILLLADWAKRHPDKPLGGVAYSLSHLLTLEHLGCRRWAIHWSPCVRLTW